MTPLVVRMVLSLCIVLGLLLLAARIAGKRYRADPGSTVKVLQRQALSRSSTVTVVSVGNRVLVLGTTEQQVRVLAELDPGEIATEAPVDASGTGPAGAVAGVAPSPLYAVPAVPAAGPHPGAPTDFAQVLLEAQQQPSAEHTAHTSLPSPTAAGRHRAAPAAGGATAQGPLAGSVLSLGTWRQALGALTGRAS